MAAGAPSGELRRLEALLEGRLGETLRAMAAQSQERAAYITALAERPQATRDDVLCLDSLASVDTFRL